MISGWLTKKSEFTTPLHWWDAAKYRFKIIAIKRSSQLRKAELHEPRQLEQKIQHLQQKLTANDQTISEQYLEAKTELQQYLLRESATSAFKMKIKH